MNQNLKKAVIGLAVMTVLAIVFWWGGNAPSLRGWGTQSGPAVTTAGAQATAAPRPAGAPPSPAPEQAAEPKEEPAESAAPTPEIKKQAEPEAGGQKPAREDGRPMTAEEKTELAEEIAGDSSLGAEPGDEEYSKGQGMEIDAATVRDKYDTAPVPEGRPIPVEPQNAEISDQAYTCTLSVRCDTILQNISWLDPEKAELVPEDGVIFGPQEVTFYEGESVFHILLREMKRNKIHLEFENTPIFNSAYIEGIHNLYEFDCGELSGWIYRVNDWFPNYGCSRYALKPGDDVEWVYTCNLGADVGGSNFGAGE